MKSEPTIAKSPWRVDENDIRDNGVYGYAVLDADGICTADHCSIENARLIAAAPELLAGCRALLRFFRGGMCTWDEGNAAEAAITKADPPAPTGRASDA